VGVMGSILVAGGMAGLLYMRKTRVAGLFVILCLMSYLLTIVGPQFIFGNLARRKATPELAEIIKQKHETGTRVVSYNWYQQGLSFYTGQRVIVVGNWGELDFGRRQGDNTAWFIDYATFNRLWDSPSRLFVLIQKPDLDRLRYKVKTPVTILGEKADKFLIANH
jgi:hypothetical protein